jgi:hypothetical protein
VRCILPEAGGSAGDEHHLAFQVNCHKRLRVDENVWLVRRVILNRAFSSEKIALLKDFSKRSGATHFWLQKKEVKSNNLFYTFYFLFVSL